MKKSPIYPKFETGIHEFDPQMEFAQFVEEARTQGQQKEKKSWRSCRLFSWLKPNKKIEEGASSSNPRAVPKPKQRGYVSGPLPGTGGRGIGKRPTSGPLSGLFSSNHTNNVADDLPYVCLDQIDSPHGLRSYGPVYLVT